MLLHVIRLTAKKSEITCRNIFIVELSAEVSLEIKAENHFFAKTEILLHVIRLTAKKSEITSRYIFIVPLLTYD